MTILADGREVRDVVLPLSAPLTGQAKVAVTGTAVPLGAGVLFNGVLVKAATSNVGTILIGTSAVTVTVGGAGNGYPLAPGDTVVFAAGNLSQVFINGTANDYVSFAGN